MKERKLLLFNSLISIFYQFVVIISGFILPKLILNSFGSATNGLISSITQFISFISLMDMGIGVVVLASLYKPLSCNDSIKISQICKSAKSFFQKVVLVFVVYLIFLIIFLPNQFQESFDFYFTASLIVIMSISSIAQYYFGMVNQLLLTADQKNYIPTLLNLIAVVLNTIFNIILISFFHVGIHIVKLTTSLIFLIRPIYMYFYVKKKYKINYSIKYSQEPIKQKYNGLAQHIAYVIVNNTDIVLLSFFSTLENVSIYAVYSLVTNGLKGIISSVSSGLNSYLGNLLNTLSRKKVLRSFNFIEWFMHLIIIWIFGSTLILIIPFVQVYTFGIEDTNYNQSIFAFIFLIATMLYCLRIPSNTLVQAAGHFRETQRSSIIEAIINLGISLLLVKNFNLTGVAIGTLFALGYRTLYLSCYLTKNIIKRPIRLFLKQILIDLLELLAICLFCNGFVLYNISYLSWISLAIKVVLTAGIIVFLFNIIFYFSYMKKGIRIVLKKIYKP